MLSQLLREIEAAQGVISLNDLSHKLAVEPGALEGMIQFWIRKGRLQDDTLTKGIAFDGCPVGGSCGCSCSGVQGCPFVMQIPRTISLTLDDR